MPLPRVIAIEQEKGRKQFRTISLENGDVFRLTEEIFFHNHFSVDDELSEDEIKSLCHQDEILRIKQTALNLLSYRKRSKLELFRRFKDKGFTSGYINEALDILEEKGYMDDIDFAESFARDKVRQTRMGPVKLSLELKKHGIGSETIQHVSHKVYLEFPIPEIIEKLIQKKRYNLSDKNEKNRCIRFLQGKGFTIEQIFSAIESYE